MTDLPPLRIGLYEAGSHQTGEVRTAPTPIEGYPFVSPLVNVPSSFNVTEPIAITVFDNGVQAATATIAPGYIGAFTTVTLQQGFHALTASAASASSTPSSTVKPLQVLKLPTPRGGIVSTSYSSIDTAKFFSLQARMQFLDPVTSIRLVDGTITIDHYSTEDTVARLYRGLLGRTYDAGGLGVYVAQVNSGATIAQIAAQMLSSTEYTSIGRQTDNQFVSYLYQGLLLRAPDQVGRANYLAALASGTSRAEAVAAMLDSDECKRVLYAPAVILSRDAAGTTVDEVYRAGLSRSPDAGGLATYKALLASASPTEFVAAITGSSEFVALHGAQSAEDFVTSLYSAALDRTPDPGGLQEYTRQLATGAASRADVLLGIATSAEATARLPSILLDPT